MNDDTNNMIDEDKIQNMEICIIYSEAQPVHTNTDIAI